MTIPIKIRGTVPEIKTCGPRDPTSPPNVDILRLAPLLRIWRFRIKKCALC